MNSRIMYIEHKTDQNDRGEAWIGLVDFSKSGQTVYFNNQAFKKLKSGSSFSNYYNLETKEDYWISGIKQNRQDRHWAGGGKIKIDFNIVSQYFAITKLEKIDETKFLIAEFKKTDKNRFKELENQKYE